MARLLSADRKRRAVSDLASIIAAADAGKVSIRCCAWCERFALDDEWLDLDEIGCGEQPIRSALLEGTTHGICDQCLQDQKQRHPERWAARRLRGGAGFAESVQANYTITWGGDPEDVCMTTSGVVRVGDLDAMWREAVADARWVEGMKVLFDHRLAVGTRMTAADFELRAEELKRMSAEIGYQQIAWVVDESALNQMGRMIFLLDWKVGFVGRSFTSMAEAREWLRRPPEPALAHVTPRPSAALPG